MRQHNHLRTEILGGASVHGLSLVGRRKENQDYCMADRRGGVCLAIVCDGLGGSVNGALASSHATRMFQHELLEVALDSYINGNRIDGPRSVRDHRENPTLPFDIFWFGGGFDYPHCPDRMQGRNTS